MGERTVDERRSSASEIVWVAFYSILVLLLMLLWVSFRPKVTAPTCDQLAMQPAMPVVGFLSGRLSNVALKAEYLYPGLG
jgi:hypothetical protein